MTNMTAAELIEKYETGNANNFEEVILELRHEGVNFVPYESEDGKIRHILIFGKSNDVFHTLLAEFQAARIFVHETVVGVPGKTTIITARALALKAAQFQREVI